MDDLAIHGEVRHPGAFTSQVGEEAQVDLFQSHRLEIRIPDFLLAPEARKISINCKVNVIDARASQLLEHSPLGVDKASLENGAIIPGNWENRG